MRVIAGLARNTPLCTVPGLDTRPTTDRIKETLFNICQPYLADCRFLDLFAGSGAIGIEALSRGASQAVFVEQSPKASACIRKNLQAAKLEKSAQVLVMNVQSSLERLKDQEPFDFIFLDPPYGKGLEHQVFCFLSHSGLVKEDTWIILETKLGEPLEYTEEYGFSLLRIKKYKTNQHVFFTRAGEDTL